MKENRLLFKVKTLEKMIVRNFIDHGDLELEEKEIILTPTQMQIMDYIITNNNQAVYQKDLEDILNLRRATVSGVLQTMEKNNLIERVTSNDDARVKKIILNSKAQTLFIEREKEMCQIEDIITREIPKEELRIFSSVLDKMQANIEKESTKVAKRKEQVWKNY